MPEVRYIPGEGDLAHTKWNGIRFRAGEWVELDDKKPEHQIEVPIPKKHVDAMGNEFTRTTLQMIPMSEMARTNPHFEVRDKGGKVEKSSTDKKRELNTSPQTAEEYQAYALKWIRQAEDADEMRARWRREASLREKVGAADAIAEEVFTHLQMKVEALELMQG